MIFVLLILCFIQSVFFVVVCLMDFQIGKMSDDFKDIEKRINELERFCYWTLDYRSDKFSKDFYELVSRVDVLERICHPLCEEDERSYF